MFKTKFVAMFLCITTVFASFAAGAFAENSISVDETIVIKDGKVVSGSSALVDSGFIVIADEDEYADTEDNAVEEDAMTEEEKLQYILGNKANFFKPVPKEEANGAADSGADLPSQTPNAVSPSVPAENTTATAQPTVADVNVPDINHPITATKPGNQWRLSYHGRGDSVGVFTVTSSTSSGITSKTATLNQNATLYFAVQENLNYSIVINSAKTLEMLYDASTYSGTNYGTDRSGTRGYLRNSTSSGYMLGRYMFSITNGGTLRMIGGNGQNDPHYGHYESDGSCTCGMSRPDNDKFLFDCNSTSNGNGSDRTSNSGAAPAFYVENGTLEIRNAIIRDSMSTTVDGRGAAIHVRSGGKVFLENVVFDNCGFVNPNTDTDYSRGGCIYVYGSGTVTLKSCRITNSVSGRTNYAEYGGAICVDPTRYNVSGTPGAIPASGQNYVLQIQDTVIQNSRATVASSTLGGGAIYIGKVVNDHSVTIKNTTIQNCYTAGMGGAIFLGEGGKLDIDGDNFTGTAAKSIIKNCYSTFAEQEKSGLPAGGGGIYAVGSATTLRIKNTFVNNCYAQNGDGGGIFSNGASLDLIGCRFENNYIKDTTPMAEHNSNVYTLSSTGYYGVSALKTGTALRVQGGTANLVNTTILKNQVGIKSGSNNMVARGAVYLSAGAVVNMIELTAAQKTSYDVGMDARIIENYGGGGVYILSNGTFRLYGGSVSNNTMYYRNPTYINATDPDGNNGYSNGAGVMLHFSEGGTPTFEMYGGTVGNHTNSTSGKGGGIGTLGKGNIYIYDGTISGNSATNGGGIYADPGSELYVEGGTIQNNAAGTDSTGHGGGIYANAVKHFFLGNQSGSKPVITGNHGTGGTTTNVLDGGGIYTVNAGIYIYNAEISGNYAKHGGGIYATINSTTSSFVVDILNCDISNNKNGSGIWINSKQFTLNMTGGTISGNTVTTSGHGFGGAGICATNGVTVNISGSAATPTVISNNVNSQTDKATETDTDTAMNGGGIACISRGDTQAAYGNTLTIKGKVTISGNSVPSSCSNNYTSKNGMGCGGGVYMEEGGTVIIQADGGYKPVISGNTAYRGGGVYVEGYSGYTTKLTVNGAAFDGNVSNEYRYILDANGNTSNPNGLAGGGVCVYKNVTVSITDTDFTNNKASMQSGVGGGAVSLVDLSAAVTIQGCTFSKNYVGAAGAAYSADSSITGDGGAIFCRNVATVNVTGCTISENKAQQGGALYVIRDSYHNSDVNRATTVNVNGCEINGNSDGALFFQRNAENVTYARAVTANIGTTTIQSNTLGKHGSHRFGGAGITCVNGITLNLNSGTLIDGNANNVQKISSLPEGISNMKEIDTAANGGGIAMITKGNADWQSCGTLTVNGGVTISNNTAKYGDGGGIYIEDIDNVDNNYKAVNAGTLIIKSSATESVTISNNTAGHTGYVLSANDVKGGNGGGIYSGMNNKISITGNANYPVIIKENNTIGGSNNFVSTGHGGAGMVLYKNFNTNGEDKVVLSYVDVLKNTSDENGGDAGGIYCVSTNLRMEHCNIKENKALSKTGSGDGDGKGGGLLFYHSNVANQLEIDDCLFKDNYASAWGGGAHLVNKTVATIKDSVFDHNSAKQGGGLHFFTQTWGGDVTLDNVFMGNNFNDVKDAGGAICAVGYKVTLKNSNIGWLPDDGGKVAAPNESKYAGGGLYLWGSQLFLVGNVDISNNKAGDIGGGVVFREHTGYNGLKDVLYIPEFNGVILNDNTAGIDGGAIYVSRDAYSTESGKTLVLKNCEVARNKATTGSGGAIYVSNVQLTINNHGSTSYCVYNDNDAGLDGGAIKVIKNDTVAVTAGESVFRISGTVFKNGDAGEDGGAISVEHAPGYVVNCMFYNNTAGQNGGAVHYVGNAVANDSVFQMAINAVGTNRDADGTDVLTSERGNRAGNFGGGLYVEACQSFVNVRGGFNYNNAKRGGGIYLLKCGNALITDDDTKFTLTGAGVVEGSGNTSISANRTTRPAEGTEGFDSTVDGNGGGLYAESNVTLTNVTMQYNAAEFDGGGLCVGKTYTVTMNGKNNVNNNVSYNYGGGIIVLSGGTLNIEGDAEGNNKTLIRGNRLITDNRGGAGIHVANNATLNMSYGEIIENGRQQDASNPAVLINAGKGSGGGIDVTGGTAVLDHVVIADNVAGTNGGGVRLTGGTLTATNCVIKGNLAANGVGGGLFVVGSTSAVTVNGFIIDNEAKGTGSGTSMVAAGNVNGVGGGVAVFDGASFSHTGGAIYNNRAETGGADVFANGLSTTKLSILAPGAMDTNGASLLGIDIPAFERDGETVGKWWEDYMTGDTNYTNGLYGDRPPAFRYADSPVSIRAYTTSAEGIQAKGNYINTDGEFVSIIFDIQKYNVGTITITAPETDVENQRFVFEITGVTDKNESVNITVSLESGESVTIEDVYPGTYQITQKTDWSWRCEIDGVEVDGGGKQDGVVTVTVDIEGVTVDDDHTVVYTGSDEANDKWLSYNSVERVNIPPNTVIPESPRVAVIDMTEAKRGYVF